MTNAALSFIFRESATAVRLIRPWLVACCTGAAMKASQRSSQLCILCAVTSGALTLQCVASPGASASTARSHGALRLVQRPCCGFALANRSAPHNAVLRPQASPRSMRSATLGALDGGDDSSPGSRPRLRVRHAASSTAGRLAAGASAEGSVRLRTAAPAGGSAVTRGGSARMSASTRAALPKAVGRPHSGRAREARCCSLRGVSSSCGTGQSAERTQ